MKTFNRNLVAAVVASAFSSSAYSQGAVLEEVLVTANKRTESLQDVAGSITAFSESQIEDRGIARVEDIFQSVPGLSFSDHAGNNLITIRSIGLQVDTGVAEPGVATHVDGVFQPRTSMGSLDIVDLERVEVLRGPQGTLYGRNATGGVINMITIKPSEEFAAGVTLGGGDVGMLKANGYVNGSLIDGTLMGRVSAWYYEDDGFYDNPGDGEGDLGASEQQGVRGALRWLPSDDLLIDLSASYQEEEYDPIQQLLDLDQPSLFGILGLTSGPDVLQSDDEHTWVQMEGYPEGNKETTSLSMIVEWNINDSMRLKSITGYIDHSQGDDWYHADGTNLQLITIGTPEVPRYADSEAFSQELNLSGVAFDDRLDWVLGLYYFDEDFDAYIPAGFGGQAQFIFGTDFAPGLLFERADQFIEEDTESYAAFANFTYSLTDTFRVNVGVRYSDDEKDIDQFVSSVVTNPLPFDVPIFGGQAFVPANSTVPITACDGADGGPLNGRNELSWDETSPKVRFEWDATDDVMLYAQWQEGFKSGGVNLSSCDDDFEPEEITSWEAGLKSTWLEGAMTLNIGAYFYEYDDLQVLTFDETGTSALVENVPESEIFGAEVEWAWAASELISLDATFSYADSEITESDLVFDSVTLLNNLVMGIADPTQALVDPTGNQLPRSPEYSASGGINLDFDTEYGRIGLRGEVYWQDDTQFRMFENPEDEAESFTVGNIYANYTLPSERLTFRAFVKNVSDEEYLYQIIHAVPSGKQGYYAPTRHWGVEATYLF